MLFRTFSFERFYLLFRKKKRNFQCISYHQQTTKVHGKHDNSQFKRLCKKDVIRKLDSFTLIENLKYVSDRNATKSVIETYMDTIKSRNETWGLNNIYFILKTVKKYDISDKVLLNSLKQWIQNVEIIESKDYDYFENVSFNRVVCILHTLIHCDYVEEKMLKPIINLLTQKIDYYIRYYDYCFKAYFEYLNKIEYDNKKEWDFNRKENQIDNLNFLNTPITDQDERRNYIRRSLRKIYFNEIYILWVSLEKIVYEKKELFNKLKLLYLITCLEEIPKNTSWKDYKYMALLYKKLYSPNDIYIPEVVAFLLSENYDLINIQELVLILMTEYYSHNEGTTERMIRKRIYTVKDSEEYEKSDDVLKFIRDTELLTDTQKRNLHMILLNIYSYKKRKSLYEIIYTKALAFIEDSYVNTIENKSINKEESKHEDELKNESPIIHINNNTKEIQSVSEFVKITNSYGKEVDILFYAHLKSNIEYFTIPTILNIYKTFLYVYNHSNELTKNYHTIKADSQQVSVTNNLHNLTSLVTQIIINPSLHRLYNECSLHDLSLLLYCIYQISNIFENKIYESYLEHLTNHINNLIVSKIVTYRWKENKLSEGEKESQVDTLSTLFHVYSKKIPNKKVIQALIRKIGLYEISHSNWDVSKYCTILNAIAKIKYRNLKLIDSILNKVREQVERLTVYEYFNLLLSLSKLNIIGINLNIYNAVFLANSKQENMKEEYNNKNEKMFLNEYNDMQDVGDSQMIHNLCIILNKFNREIDCFVFSPNFKTLYMITNILSSYTILGFDKIHFNNINKLLECVSDYIFNYFTDTEEYAKQYETNPIGSFEKNYKNLQWYFSEKNVITLTRVNKNYKKVSLYIPIQCIYQLYIFNIYFNLYLQYISKKCDYKEKRTYEKSDIVKEISNTGRSSYWHDSNVYELNRKQDRVGIDFNVHRKESIKVEQVLSEKSKHLLKNIVQLVQYINHFYEQSFYEKYNLLIPNVWNTNNDKNGTFKSLIDLIKTCEIHINKDDSSQVPSSFHRDVYSVLKIINIRNIECEVPFLHGIYTLDIVINNSVCIEINGNNHYYCDEHLKRTHQKMDALSLLKYFLLLKKYRLILISYLDWDGMSSIEEKKEYLINRIEI